MPYIFIIPEFIPILFSNYYNKHKSYSYGLEEAII